MSYVDCLKNNKTSNILLQKAVDIIIPDSIKRREITPLLHYNNDASWREEKMKETHEKVIFKDLDE